MNRIENWLLNKVAKKPETFWAKIILGLCFFGLSLVFILKYKDNISKLDKLKTKNALSENDKKDAVLQQQLKNLKDKKGALIKEVIKSDSNINKIDGNISKTKRTASSDLEIIESLDSWEEVDDKIK